MIIAFLLGFAGFAIWFLRLDDNKKKPHWTSEGEVCQHGHYEFSCTPCKITKQKPLISEERAAGEEGNKD